MYRFHLRGSSVRRDAFAGGVIRGVRRRRRPFVPPRGLKNAATDRYYREFDRHEDEPPVARVIPSWPSRSSAMTGSFSSSPSSSSPSSSSSWTTTAPSHHGVVDDGEGKQRRPATTEAPIIPRRRQKYDLEKARIRAPLDFSVFECSAFAGVSPNIFASTSRYYHCHRRARTTMTKTTTCETDGMGRRQLYRSSSSSSRGDATGAGASVFDGAAVHVRGDLPYGSREYLLLPRGITLQDVHYIEVEKRKRRRRQQRQAKERGQQRGSIIEEDDRQDEDKGKENRDKLDGTNLVLASLRAHRNILFAARINGDDGDDDDLRSACGSLVEAALRDAGENGDQPQAMATLHGLCGWVRRCLRGQDESDVLQSLRRPDADGRKGVVLEAVAAIATGVPRRKGPAGTENDGGGVGAPATGDTSSTTTSTSTGVSDDETIEAAVNDKNNSSSGNNNNNDDDDDDSSNTLDEGTYLDGRIGWEALAKEYVHRGLSAECELYKSHGGELVAIEHMADRNPGYLKSAGGAMARFFFIAS